MSRGAGAGEAGSGDRIPRGTEHLGGGALMQTLGVVDAQ